MTLFGKLYWRVMDKLAKKGCLDKFVNIVSDYMLAAGQDVLIIKSYAEFDNDDRCTDRYTERIVLYEDEDSSMASSIRKGIDMTIESIRSARGL